VPIIEPLRPTLARLTVGREPGERLTAHAGVELHLPQLVAGHQDPAVTSRYLHPDTQAVLDAGPHSRSGGPERA